jgi:TPR repeat protein
MEDQDSKAKQRSWLNSVLERRRQNRELARQEFETASFGNNISSLETLRKQTMRFHDRCEVSQDDLESLSWWVDANLKRANDGELASQVEMAICYIEGRGLQKDEQMGRHWYLTAIEQSNLYLIYDFGLSFISQAKVGNYIELAIYCFEKIVAIKSQLVTVNDQFLVGEYFGEIRTCRLLADIYENEKYGLNDLNKAYSWYVKATEFGSVETMTELGSKLSDGTLYQGNHNYAEHWFIKAAERGSYYEKHKLAKLYSEGAKIPQDIWKAIYWLKAAANSGSPEAANELGEIYQRGKGVEIDDSIALNWFIQAADIESDSDGVIKAMINLGLIYEHGIGVERDEYAAFRWYSLAGDTNGTWVEHLDDDELHGPVRESPRAQYHLGRMYQNGSGVERDEKKAAEWFSKAGNSGGLDAVYSLALLREKMGW